MFEIWEPARSHDICLCYDMFLLVGVNNMLLLQRLQRVRLASHSVFHLTKFIDYSSEQTFVESKLYRYSKMPGCPIALHTKISSTNQVDSTKTADSQSRDPLEVSQLETIELLSLLILFGVRVFILVTNSSTNIRLEHDVR